MKAPQGKKCTLTAGPAEEAKVPYRWPASNRLRLCDWSCMLIGQAPRMLLARGRGGWRQVPSRSQAAVLDQLRFQPLPIERCTDAREDGVKAEPDAKQEGQLSGQSNP
jgi:hypothetical protein